jgi:hypothetical protein
MMEKRGGELWLRRLLMKYLRISREKIVLGDVIFRYNIAVVITNNQRWARKFFIFCGT